ncbi:MAG: hypothetical protein ACTSRZ_08790 [Promethearchaeota archaeon]
MRDSEYGEMSATLLGSIVNLFIKIGAYILIGIVCIAKFLYEFGKKLYEWSMKIFGKFKEDIVQDII